MLLGVLPENAGDNFVALEAMIGQLAHFREPLVVVLLHGKGTLDSDPSSLPFLRSSVSVCSNTAT